MKGTQSSLSLSLKRSWLHLLNGDVPLLKDALYQQLDLVHLHSKKVVRNRINYVVKSHSLSCEVSE